MSEQTLTSILDRLNHVALQLNEVVGFHHDSYAKKVEDAKEKRSDLTKKDEDQLGIKATLSSKEKSHYSSIAKEFEKILKVGKLKDAFDKIKDSVSSNGFVERLKNALNIAPVTKEVKQVRDMLSSHFRAKQDLERAKRIKEVRKPNFIPKTKEPVVETGLLGKLLKGLGLGALLGLIGGAIMLAANAMKLGSLKDIMQFIGKYASLAGLKTIIASASTFIHALTAPFQLMSKLFTGKTATEIISKGTLKFGGDFFAKALPTLTKIFGRGLKFLKPIPVLGSLISFYFAYKSFKNGDVIDGMFEIASGLANFVPGIGTAISIGIDLLNIARKASPDTVGKFANKATSFLDTLKTIGGGVIGTVAEWFSELPIIRNLIEAVQALKSGDSKGALRAIGLEWIVSKNSNEIFDSLKTKGVHIIDNVTEWFSKLPIIRNLIEAVKALKAGDKKGALRAIGLEWLVSKSDDEIFNSEKVRQIKESIKHGIESFFETLGGWFSKIWDGLLTVKDKVFGFFQSDKNAIKTTAKDLADSAGLQVVSSLNSQLAKLSEIATILNNQYVAMLENNKLLQQIIYNTGAQAQKITTTQLNTVSPIESFYREENSYTRKSYINDFKQLNAYVRESFA